LEFRKGSTANLLGNKAWNSEKTDIQLVYKDNQPFEVLTKTKSGLVRQTLTQFEQQMSQHCRAMVEDFRALGITREQEQEHHEARMEERAITKEIVRDHPYVWDINEVDGELCFLITLGKQTFSLRPKLMSQQILAKLRQERHR